jgi:signal transduction histidine kinase
MVNAAQAMAEHQCEKREVVVRCSRLNSSIVTEVIDTGPGFDEHRAALLFNAFYTTKAAGMGIGLSVSKTIIELHGGTIAATSRQGEGACFRFELPITSMGAE